MVVRTRFSYRKDNYKIVPTNTPSVVLVSFEGKGGDNATNVLLNKCPSVPSAVLRDIVIYVLKDSLINVSPILTAILRDNGLFASKGTANVVSQKSKRDIVFFVLKG